MAGKIVLFLSKKQKVSFVKVDVHGFVYIKNLLLSGRSVTKDLCRLTIDLWTADEAASTAGSETSSTANSALTSGSDSSYLFLPAGEHRFPFEFSLPTTGLMSSLTFERGNISYLVTGLVKRPGRNIQQSLAQPLSITVPLDVANLPPAKVTRIAIDVMQRRRSHSQGSPSKVIVQLELPAKGYIRGEEIPVQLTIKHQWLVQSSAGIILTLVRIARLEGADIDSQTFRKDLDQTVLPLYTDPKTLTAHVVGTLRVPPDAFPTMRHRELVTFQYMLEMTMDVTGKRDLQKYVARDPAFTLIDTVELKQKSGIVSAWTEVIIGTSRTTIGGNTHDPSRLRQQATALSERSMHVELSSLSSSAAPSPVTTPPSAQQTAAEEKAELAAREATLLPSAPPMPLGAIQEISAPGCSTVLTHSQPEHDKQELEHQRLQEMTSAPEDFVPRYEASAPSGSSVPPVPPGPSAPVPSAPPAASTAPVSAPISAPMPNRLASVPEAAATESEQDAEQDSEQDSDTDATTRH